MLSGAASKARLQQQQQQLVKSDVAAAPAASPPRLRGSLTRAPPPDRDGSWDPEMDARVAQLFPDVPETLEFESWWNERPRQTSSGAAVEPMHQPPTRRFMLLRFFPATGQVEVQTDDAVVPMTIVVATRGGAPLRPWDLHVGVTIDVLGRSTTLHSANFRTMDWLDDNCRRLWRFKERIEARRNRFVSVPHIALDYGAYRLLVQPSNGTKVTLGGRACPGKIARTIVAIQDELARFQ
jgi:hypothetical protein